MPAEQENNDQATPQLTIDESLDKAFFCYKNADLAESERLCRLVLAEIPDQIDAMQLLGQILSQREQFSEAIDFLRQAITLAPGHAAIHNNLGMALYRTHETEKAAFQFKKAIELRPDFAKAHNNLAAAFMKLGQLDQAIQAASEAIRLQADFKQAYNNLGLALKKNGNLTEAIAAYEKALDIDGQYVEVLSNLGMALIDQGKLEQAGINLQKAVALAPDSAQCLNNLGVLFNRQGRFDLAIAASEKAIAICDDYLQAYNNLGTALMELERFAEAKTAFEKAIAIDENCAQPHHNLSLVLLLNSEFKRGWEEYEWRWRHEGFTTPKRPFTQKWWDGSTDGVGKLLVWGEQGIGDEVQFAALIDHIEAKGIEVVVECDKRLAGLLQRSFIKATIVERRDPPDPTLKDLSITHQIPICSLPKVLGLGPNEKPMANPYIYADQNRRNSLRDKYKTGKNPLLVGISWKSGNSQEGPKRSIDLEYWEPILEIQGVRFISLQYGQCTEQLLAAKNRFGVEIFEDKTINSFKDIEGFAAQVAAMDLVISVDNSTVHFAGALGVEVWTMLPTVPDWRWGLQSDSTWWYPAMRLFRQQKRADWQPVVLKVAEELTNKMIIAP